MIAIEHATRTDAAALVALIDSAYRGESGLRGWTTETHLIGGQRTDIEEIRSLLSQDGVEFFVQRDAHQNLLACCMLERRAHQAYFGMFAVSPTQQSQGHGSRLLQHAETYAKTHWHAREMVMSVIKQRPELLAWYRRKGYLPTGNTLPFPYGDPRAGLPKRQDLVFLVLKKSL